MAKKQDEINEKIINSLQDYFYKTLDKREEDFIDKSDIRKIFKSLKKISEKEMKLIFSKKLIEYLNQTFNKGRSIKQIDKPYVEETLQKHIKSLKLIVQRFETIPLDFQDISFPALTKKYKKSKISDLIDNFKKYIIDFENKDEELYLVRRKEEENHWRKMDSCKTRKEFDYLKSKKSVELTKITVLLLDLRYKFPYSITKQFVDSLSNDVVFLAKGPSVTIQKRLEKINATISAFCLEDSWLYEQRLNKFSNIYELIRELLAFISMLENDNKLLKKNQSKRKKRIIPILMRRHPYMTTEIFNAMNLVELNYYYKTGDAIFDNTHVKKYNDESDDE